MEDFKFLRQPEPEKPELPEGEEIDLGDLEAVKLTPDALVIDLPDGSVSLSFGGLGVKPPGEASDHDINLTNFIDAGTLSAVADDLIRLINDDSTRQEQRLSDMVKAVELLGVKLKEPKAEASAEGISTVTHPLLLESVLRFQANARGELLPADGPVKVANEGDDTRMLNEQSNQLEKDFNHYLTSGAPEYYPDFDRSLFSLGLNGEVYRKVYWHPIKRRPVVETIDRKDIIISDGAVSLEACGRITHRSRMRPSIVKQMQLVGAWRDVPLGGGVVSPDTNRVDEKLSDIAGVQQKLLISGQEEQDREIYECYCELDLVGFEHEEDGEKTGLPLPYRVTIDKESRQILEIRRWWEEGDENFVRKECFVSYVFVPAFDGLNLGLSHILGNSSRALTAAWRIALDNGMLANFPGGIMVRATGKQQSTTIRVGAGQVAPVDTDGLPLAQAFMPLPYRDVTSGFVSIIQGVEQAAQRLAGTAETAVGEGRSDAPVGTTIAMIEQAQKILSAVHKRMHVSQSREFALLKDLFRRDPKALWRSNKNPGFQKDVAMLQEALDNKDIVPKADPNTASHSMRVQKAIALKTLASQSPMLYDMVEVDKRILAMRGIDDAAELFNKNPPMPPQQDEAKLLAAKASMTSAQAKLMDTSIKAQQAQGDMSLKAADIQTKNLEAATKRTIAKTDALNHKADREGKLRLAAMELKQSELVHSDKLAHEKEMKGLDLSRALRERDMDLASQQMTKGLDLEEARRQHERDLAHEADQAHTDRVHDLIMERQRATMGESLGSSNEGNE